MIRPGRTRRIVFYVGSFDSFREYVNDEVERLLGMDGNPVLPVVRSNGGRTCSIERGRRFEYLGIGVGDVTRGMRGLSASRADVVFGPENRLRYYRRHEVAEHALYVTAGATEAERQRERDIDEACRVTGEPYEIIVEAFEALDACNDYPPELTS